MYCFEAFSKPITVDNTVRRWLLLVLHTYSFMVEAPLSSTFNVGHSLRPPILSKVDKATKAGSNVTQPAVVGLWPSFYSFFYL